MKKFDHVVIGSGISGLTAAIILGKSGKNVALLEQHSNTAPLIRRFKRGNSWCDPGFHYSGGLNNSGQLTILLRYLGVADHIKTLPMDADGFDILSFNGQTEYKIPYGFDRLRDYLCQHFPNSSSAIQKYLEKVEEINTNTAFMNPDKPFTEFSSEIYLNNSLESFLKSTGAEQKLIDLLSNHGYALYGSSASEVPMHTHAYIMGSFYKSASLVADGGNGFVNAFEDEMKKYNVSVFTNCSASGFNIDERRVLKGVYTESENYFECDSCICTIHPKLLIDMLNNTSVRPAYINRIKKLENTMASVVLFVETDVYPSQVLKTNYYEFNTNASLETDTDYTAYMAVNPEAETRGKRSFAVIKPVVPSLFDKYFDPKHKDDHQNYNVLKERVAADTFNKLVQKFPELKNKAKILDVSTPVTYNRYTNTVNGSMYGIKQSVAYRGLTTRTSIHNLYLAGQSIQMGVMGSIISAFIAALNMVDRERLEKEIRQCH